MVLIKSKKGPLLSLLFKILGFCVGLTAITLQLFTNAIIGKGFMANHVLAYFTIQTNILSTFIFLLLIIKTIVNLVKTHKLEIVNINKSLHLACTFYITITMTVYWLVLAPMLGVGDSPLAIANTLFLHLFTPLFAIIDCVLFYEHGTLTKKDSIKWLAYPAFYLLLIIIIANVSDVPYYKFKIGEKVISLHYPYPFIDPQVVGVYGFIGIIILLFVFCILFGLLYIMIDNKIAKIMAKKSEKEN